MGIILIYLPPPRYLNTSTKKKLFGLDLGFSMRHTCMCVRHPLDESYVIQVLKLQNNAGSCRGTGFALHCVVYLSLVLITLVMTNT